MYTCRYCKKELNTMFVDLGLSPLSNDYIKRENVIKGQYELPLKAAVCEECKLVQILDFELPEGIFNEEYKYFSSYSSSWLAHCKSYTDKIIQRLNLKKDAVVMEVASNDGYLLQYFKEYGFHPIGVEPSRNTAEIAIQKGIDTRVEFFNMKFAEKFDEKVTLLIANNVLAHVPDIKNFVKAMKTVLDENGTITIEFPHLLNILKYNQFDTIYHEHFSYLSILAVKKIFEEQGLKIYDIEKLHTHGGSLRLYVTHMENGNIPVLPSVEELLNEELDFGLDRMETYTSFSKKVQKMKREILEKLIEIKNNGKTIVGYGAAAKGNTLLNYCGIGTDFIDYVVDANPQKQGCLLPGSLIPILHPDKIKETKPDYILIIPWNLQEEIMKLLEDTKEWGAKFLVCIPKVKEFIK